MINIVFFQLRLTVAADLNRTKHTYISLVNFRAGLKSCLSLVSQFKKARNVLWWAKELTHEVFWSKK